MGRLSHHCSLNAQHGPKDEWMQEQEAATGSGLFCLGRVVLSVTGATQSRVEEGPEGQLRPMAGEAGGTQPLECGESRPRPRGSCGRPGQVAPVAQGGRHRTGIRPWLQGRGPRPHRHPGKQVQGYVTQNMKQGTLLTSKHVDKWAQIHRPQ